MGGGGSIPNNLFIFYDTDLLIKAFINKKYAQRWWWKSVKHIISNYYSTILKWEVKFPVVAVV